MRQWTPIREGTTGSDKRAGGYLKPLVCSASDTLQTLSTTGVLFTHASCYVHLPIPTDPLMDFLARRSDIDVFVLMSQTPFFSGFEKQKHWNHALLWVPTIQWPLIRSLFDNCVFRLGGQTTADPLAGVTECGWCQTLVPDRPLLDKSVVLPPVWQAEVQVVTLRNKTRETKVGRCTDPSSVTPILFGDRHES